MFSRVLVFLGIMGSCASSGNNKKGGTATSRLETSQNADNPVPEVAIDDNSESIEHPAAIQTPQLKINCGDANDMYSAIREAVNVHIGAPDLNEISEDAHKYYYQLKDQEYVKTHDLEEFLEKFRNADAIDQIWMSKPAYTSVQ
ncbi:hypothetical protein EDC01DRAFT_379467 [Geopyxis carbonaria]|nr:hypothetical protein EDC01DRAFT_379467 [Geopyxis carbonaria]